MIRISECEHFSQHREIFASTFWWLYQRQSSQCLIFLIMTAFAEVSVKPNSLCNQQLFIWIHYFSLSCDQRQQLFAFDKKILTCCNIEETGLAVGTQISKTPHFHLAIAVNRGLRKSPSLSFPHHFQSWIWTNWFSVSGLIKW